MDTPRRKSMRLEQYDYNTPGAYFITVCTRERRCILALIEKSPINAVGALHEAPAVGHWLTPEGECVRRYIEAIPARWPAVRPDRYVIMPNHIHLLLTIDGEQTIRERAIRESPLQPGGLRSLLDKVIGYLKMNSSRDIHRIRPGELIWQRSYYDHVVRNGDDFCQIADYIDANPTRWAEDRFYRE